MCHQYLELTQQKYFSVIPLHPYKDRTTRFSRNPVQNIDEKLNFTLREEHRIQPTLFCFKITKNSWHTYLTSENVFQSWLIILKYKVLLNETVKLKIKRLNFLCANCLPAISFSFIKYQDSYFQIMKIYSYYCEFYYVT